MRTNPILRRTRLALAPALLIGLGVGLTACNDDDDKQESRTVTSVARNEIAQSTTDTAVPIQLNDLMLSESDTTDTGQPGEI